MCAAKIDGLIVVLEESALEGGDAPTLPTRERDLPLELGNRGVPTPQSEVGVLRIRFAQDDDGLGGLGIWGGLGCWSVLDGLGCRSVVGGVAKWQERANGLPKVGAWRCIGEGRTFAGLWRKRNTGALRTRAGRCIGHP